MQRSILPKKKARDGETIAKPQLTSLLDVMTILLVFLIQNFSTSGNLMAVSKDVDLASSKSKVLPIKALTLEVGLHHIAVDGVRLEYSVEKAKDANTVIPILLAQLEQVQQNVPEGIDPSSVMIQCDKGVDFAVLKRVLATCSRAKVERFTLLVKGGS